MHCCINLPAGESEGEGEGSPLGWMFRGLGNVFSKMGAEISKMVQALAGAMKSAFSGLVGLFGGARQYGGDVVPRAHVHRG
jgi:hypothetical protein